MRLGSEKQKMYSDCCITYVQYLFLSQPHLFMEVKGKLGSDVPWMHGEMVDDCAA